jgi:hypothetical protein
MKLYEAIEKALENPDLILIYQDKIRYKMVNSNPNFILERQARVDENPPLHFYIEDWSDRSLPFIPENIKTERPTAKSMLCEGWEIEEPKEEFKPYSIDVWLDTDAPKKNLGVKDKSLKFRLIGDGCYDYTAMGECKHKFKITVEKADD